jgi:anti-sigma factor RsiW
MELAPDPICDRVRGQISLELDGELSQLERVMIAKHVERCPSCAHFREGLSEITSALREAPLEALARPIEMPRLRRAMLADLRRGTVRVAAAAAGMALVLSLGLANSGVFGPGTPREQPAAHSAYLQSMDYESQLIREQADRSNGTRMNIAV